MHLVGRGEGNNTRVGEFCREYEREATSTQEMEAFPAWLRARCSVMEEGRGTEMKELLALSCVPSRRICSFRSMLSHGSHYRVEEDEGDARHVTYDSGVAELRAHEGGVASSCEGVEIIRVGTLQDILVLDYGNTNTVLMVVSWLAKDTELQPRLRRDLHGFWLANMAAVPRCNKDPYILPSLATQVGTPFLPQMSIVRCLHLLTQANAMR